MKKNSEDHIHVYLVSFLRKLQLLRPLMVVWHTPNGGQRNAKEGAKLKMMGVLAGVPDLTLAHAGGIDMIELKAINGKVSPAQEYVINTLRALGHPTTIIKAQSPGDAINQAAPILLRIGYTQNEISKCWASALGGLKS